MEKNRYEQKQHDTHPLPALLHHRYVSLIVTLILLCSFFFYYIRTDRILTTSYEHSVTGQFGQVNQKISDQVDSIDSIIPPL